YDAIARPQTKDGKTSVEITDETVKELSGKLGLAAEVTAGDVAALLLPLLGFVKPTVKAEGEIEGGKKKSESKAVSYELIPVDTPQSQLEALTVLYLTNYAKRVFFANFKSSADWRDPASIVAVPRSLIFLDLPGYDEAIQEGCVQTKLIPMAAEF